MTRFHINSNTDKDGIITEAQVPFTFQEEIQADAADFWKQIALDVIGGLPWPKDYEEFKLRLNMTKAVNAMLTRNGINPINVSAQTKQILGITMEFAIWSVIYIHGKLPSEVL